MGTSPIISLSVYQQIEMTRNRPCSNHGQATGKRSLEEETVHRLKHKNQLELEFPRYQDVTGLRTVGEFHQGADLVLGVLVDRIQISSPNPSLLRYLVIARILHPVSKIRTLPFLNRNFGTRLKKDQVYQFLDNLSKFPDEILDSLKKYALTNYCQYLNLLIMISNHP
jgi:hypothetical protein